MNSKTLLKTLLPISTIALIGGVSAFSLVLTSCDNNEPTEVASKIDGSNWQGRISGSFINDENWGWEIDDVSQTVTYAVKAGVGTNPSKYIANNLFIPAFVSGAETNNELYRVIIGNRAFSSVVLAQVHIDGFLYLNEGLTTIGEYAFDNACIKGLALPSSITSIENYAFQNCRTLSFVDLSACNNLTTIIGPQIFQNDSEIETLSLSKRISVSSTAFPMVGELFNFNLFLDYDDLGDEFEGPYNGAFWFNAANLYDASPTTVGGTITLFGDGWSDINKHLVAESLFGEYDPFSFGTTWSLDNWEINIVNNNAN